MYISVFTSSLLILQNVSELDRALNSFATMRAIHVTTFWFKDKMNGKRPTSQCAFWCGASFYKVQYEHIKRDMNWACTCVRFEFPGVCSCQKLAKSDKIW